jgi:hypothetical protein
MTIATLTPLAENAGLAFLGEPEWTPAVVTPRQVEIIHTSLNPSGRPNADALRGFLGLAANKFRERWQVDFAPHLTVQEAALYEAPFAILEKKRGSAKAGQWWVNPNANLPLRAALARLDRFLVTPITGTKPVWTWVDAGWLPDHSLLAVARDDEFAQGVLQSRMFAAWWKEGCQTRNPLPVLECFPFPWPPHAAFGSLTGIQQDLRYEVARAMRNRDAAQLDAVVATAYGCPPGLADDELLLRLQRLHHRRGGNREAG